MHAIEFEQVSKNFAEQAAITQLSLMIPTSSRCVLLGCSGAGKTTALRLVAGLEQADSGRILLDGQDATHLPASQRHVSLLGQRAALYPQLTIQRNLLVALRHQSLTRAAREKLTNEMLDRFHIRGLANRLPAEISGGESQRAALAKALMARPRLLLLDEPLNQLDGPNKENAIDLLEEVLDQIEATVILVTHDPIDALRLGNYMALLHEGRLLDAGPPDALYRQPRSRLSGSLLSPFGMNWLDTTQLADSVLRQFGDKRFIGFRPESARTEATNDAISGRISLSFKTRSIQNLGFASLIIGEHQGQIVKLMQATGATRPNGLISIAHGDLCGVDA